MSGSRQSPERRMLIQKAKELLEKGHTVTDVTIEMNQSNRRLAMVAKRELKYDEIMNQYPSGGPYPVCSALCYYCTYNQRDANICAYFIREKKHFNEDAQFCTRHTEDKSLTCWRQDVKPNPPDKQQQ